MKTGVDGVMWYFALRERLHPSHVGCHHFHHKIDADGEVRSSHMMLQRYHVNSVGTEETISPAEVAGDNAVPQLSLEEVLARLPAMEAPVPAVDPDTGTLYCPECYLPLHPDPNPQKLYIFLHALKYTTSLGSFETEMPEWASEGWEWEALIAQESKTG